MMKDDEQRIAIAEICGWRYDEINDRWASPFGKRWEYTFTLPNYLNDLSLMYSAEESLTDEQWVDYIEQLEAVTHTDGWPIMTDSEQRRMIHATAEQRSEAFLRAHGKWTKE